MDEFALADQPTVAGGRRKRGLALEREKGAMHS